MKKKESLTLAATSSFELWSELLLHSKQMLDHQRLLKVMLRQSMSLSGRDALSSSLRDEKFSSGVETEEGYQSQDENVDKQSVRKS